MRINVFGDFVASGQFACPSVCEKLHSMLINGDINICNFEAPINSEGKPTIKSGPNIQQPIESIEWLKLNKFNVVTLANNHILDYGVCGYHNTIMALKPIEYLGAGEWKNAYRPLIIEKEGLRIGLLALTHCEFGTLTDVYDKEHSIGTAWINHPSVDKIIIETRKNVDYLIVLPHAGLEDYEIPLPEWRDRYRSFINLGCDAVIAGHPHIIQGYEEYEGKPIFYSLGNFYFPNNNSELAWYYSVGVSINISAKGFTFNVIPLKFEDSYIEVCKDNDSYVKANIDRANAALLQDDTYIERINTICEKMLDYYIPAFGISLDDCNHISFLQRVRLALWKYRFPNYENNNQCLKLWQKTFILNNLRCESHRFCISRAIKNRLNIQ